MTSKKCWATVCLLSAALFLPLVLPLHLPVVRADSNETDLREIFKKRDVMIPMRDGVRLHTEIYIPKHATGPLPFLFERTPYGLDDDENGFSRKFAIYKELIPEGYIFVFQDIRGRYGSEATRRPLMKAPMPTTPSVGC
jgi:predicted acyl esterase